MSPVVIDKDELIAALEECAAYLADNAGLAEEAVAQLRSFGWRALIERSDVTKAGRDPAAWLAVTEELALAADESLIAPIGIVLACAVRPLLETVAAKIMESLQVTDSSHMHVRPLRCPACGGHASVGFVGPTRSSEGNGRMLYCSTCATTWEFERLRCAHCGSQNQGKLHYFHIEGDSAHRLHLCDECGSYLRTVFANELAAPLSYEVEDVIMARLDMVAHDRRFTSNNTE
jgi:FdhE protein